MRSPASSRVLAPSALIASLFVLAACAADQSTTPLTHMARGASVLEVDPGYVKVCKSSGPAGTYAFDIGVTGGGRFHLPWGASTALDFDGTVEECKFVYAPVLDESWEDADAASVTIAELLPTGIRVAQVDVYNLALPYPGFVQTLTGSNSATVAVNPFDQFRLFFHNEQVPPDDKVCPAVAVVPSLAELSSWLFIFTDGTSDANWQGATKGFRGDVAVFGRARKRTSGGVPFAGTIVTDATTLGSWQSIVDQNPGQAARRLGQDIGALETSLGSAFAQIDALVAHAPSGFNGSPASLVGLNTQDGVAQTYVLNMTSGFGVSSQISITGDATDVFVMRWDTDADPTNGYQGQVKFQSGGAIIPLGGLTPASFVHVAGDINASGGGASPAAPYPQGPELANGANWKGGGFFTGYWLTTGNAKRETASLSNAIFVGGWYSSTTKFSMTSGTSGTHVECPSAP